jgi:hypothetical protein
MTISTKNANPRSPFFVAKLLLHQAGFHALKLFTVLSAGLLFRWEDKAWDGARTRNAEYDVLSGTRLS